MMTTIERVFPWTHRALVRHLVSFLCSDDALHLAQTHRVCLTAVRVGIRDFQRRSARLALALYCMRSLRIEFQSYYQELETQRIARSQTNDPRVPPRVVSIWSERGKVRVCEWMHHMHQSNSSVWLTCVFATTDADRSKAVS